jgi:SSS family solute:Na+ symporter
MVLLSTIDNVVIGLFTVFIVCLGVYFSRAVKDMESFYLGSRNLPWSLIVGALVATWYGGVGTIGTVEYGAIYGLSVWAIWCVTAHAGRMPLALWVGPKIHVRTDLTVPDLLESTYGKGVAILGAIMMFIYCTQIGNVTAMGFIGEATWGISNVTAGVFCVALVVVLAAFGGLMGVAVTDMVLFWAMCFGLTMVMPGQWTDIGGWAGLQQAFASTPKMLDPMGGLTPMKAFMLIVLSFGVYADPTFYQRFSAADSPKAGRRALLSCFVLWVCFDILLTLVGLVVKVKYPDLAPAEGYIKLVLGSLPEGVRALFIIGLVGGTVSALDGYFLSGGATLANDLYARLKKGKLTQLQLVTATRLGIVIVGVLSLSVAFQFPTAQDAFIFVSSLWMAAGFVPIVGALVWPGRKTALGGYLGLVMGALVFSYFKLYPLEAFELEPLVAALPLSFIFWIIGNQFGKTVQEKSERVV